jgi:hypothetical protein
MAEQQDAQATGLPAETAAQTMPAATGEIQQASATDSSGSSASGQVADTQDVADDFEWNGSNVEDLPKPLQNRARGMLRYFHKTTQDIADAKRKAEAFDRIQGDPRFKTFIDSQQQSQPANTQPPIATPEALPLSLTQEDVLQLQSGDPQAVQSVLWKAGAPLVQELQNLRTELLAEKNSRRVDSMEREIDAFASVHPDFWDVDQRVMKAAMSETVKGGGTIAQAYQLAKEIEKGYVDRVKKTIRAEVDNKKKATVASPSRSAEINVVEVDNEQDAKRVAAEAAWDNKRVEVRVRKKGNR